MPTAYDDHGIEAAIAALHQEAAASAGRVELMRKGFDPADIWTTEEFRAAFDVVGFMAPCVGVTRKCDGVFGTVFFTPSHPRLYYGFERD